MQMYKCRYLPNNLQTIKQTIICIIIVITIANRARFVLLHFIAQTSSNSINLILFSKTGSAGIGHRVMILLVFECRIFQNHILL